MRLTKEIFGLGLVLALVEKGKCQSFDVPSGICHFSLSSYTGGWYELATSHNVSQTIEVGCICSSVYYTTNTTDSSVLDLTNSCIRWGNYYSVSGNAYSNLYDTDGSLFVNFTTWPFQNKKQDTQVPNYIILKTYDDLGYALVGGNNENYWWLLSRSPNWNETVWNNARYVLLSNGYSVGNYSHTEQSCQFLGGHNDQNLIPPGS